MSGGGGAEPRPAVVRSVKAEGGEPHLIESGWNGRMLYAGRSQMAAQYESARQYCVREAEGTSSREAEAVSTAPLRTGRYPAVCDPGLPAYSVQLQYTGNYCNNREDDHLLKVMRYSGYAWMSWNITKMPGLATLSVTLSYRSVELDGFLAGGATIPCCPAQNSPVRTRARYMCLRPLGSGTEYWLCAE